MDITITDEIQTYQTALLAANTIAEMFTATDAFILAIDRGRHQAQEARTTLEGYRGEWQKFLASARDIARNAEEGNRGHDDVVQSLRTLLYFQASQTPPTL